MNYATLIKYNKCGRTSTVTVNGEGHGLTIIIVSYNAKRGFVYVATTLNFELTFIYY